MPEVSNKVNIEDLRSALWNHKEGPVREEAFSTVVSRPFWCYKILTSYVEISSEEYSQLLEGAFSWMKQHHFREVLSVSRDRLTLEQRVRITRRLCGFKTVDASFLYWCLRGMYTFSDMKPTDEERALLIKQLLANEHCGIMSFGLVTERSDQLKEMGITDDDVRKLLPSALTEAKEGWYNPRKLLNSSAARFLTEHERKRLEKLATKAA
ncbi:MAG TPA: hypothetical protein VN665_03835 [Candidatus Paceibacterota bacterium]|nr:hypothetical protein [Candidatus Paceibacterota bacterium]